MNDPKVNIQNLLENIVFMMLSGWKYLKIAQFFLGNLKSYDLRVQSYTISDAQVSSFEKVFESHIILDRRDWSILN